MAAQLEKIGWKQRKQGIHDSIALTFFFLKYALFLSVCECVWTYLTMKPAFLTTSCSCYQHAQPPWLLRGVSFRLAALLLADGLASPFGLSFIFSQMASTRLSKTCFTLTLSLALASKNWKPVSRAGRERGNQLVCWSGDRNKLNRTQQISWDLFSFCEVRQVTRFCQVFKNYCDLEKMHDLFKLLHKKIQTF